jgi:outer membrane immunogenic protein
MVNKQLFLEAVMSLCRTGLLCTLVAGLAFGQSDFAMAADLRTPVRVTSPPIVSEYDWTGIYLGGHGGYGWGNVSWGDIQALDTAAEDDTLDGEGPRHRPRGAIAGGHVGAQYQWGALVMGLEVSGAFAWMRATSCCQFGALDDVYTTRIESIFQAVGRMGFAAGLWHGYIKGGYAGARVGIEIVDSVGTPTRGADKQWRDGFSVGGGLEFAITPNWIAGMDYSYINLSNQDQTISLIGDGSVTYGVAVPTIHAVVGRLTYKVGAPLAARY